MVNNEKGQEQQAGMCGGGVQGEAEGHGNMWGKLAGLRLGRPYKNAACKA